MAKPWHGLVHAEVGQIRVPLSATPSQAHAASTATAGRASLRPRDAERWRRSPEELDDNHPAWIIEAEYLALGILSATAP